MDDSARRKQGELRTHSPECVPDEILDGDELVRRLFESSPPMAGDSEESLEMQREMMEQWSREAEEEKAESEANKGED